jgi:two-component system CheB/CheR fusion protein
MKERAADEPFRIWVPGCASGEEAYSLVICLLEFLGETDSTLPIQMFATDLSAAAVARARAATFPASIEHEVSANRLRRFFVKTDGRYQVSKAIRDVCVFAPQDLTRDAPFSRLDLISCCNVLIYLSTALQERVPVLHYALKSTGFLKLGPRRASAGSRTSSLSSPRSKRSTRENRGPRSTWASASPPVTGSPRRPPRRRRRQTGARRRSRRMPTVSSWDGMRRPASW